MRTDETPGEKFRSASPQPPNPAASEMFQADCPDPLLRVSAAGGVISANEQARTLLEAWNAHAGDGRLREAVAVALRCGSVRELELADEGRTHALLIVPVAEQGYAEVFGFEIKGSPAGDGNGAHRGFLATAIARSRADEQVRASRERVGLMATVAGRLLRTPDPQSVVDELCRIVAEHLDLDVFVSFMVDPDERTLRLNAAGGLPAETVRRFETIETGSPLCGSVAERAQAIVLERIRESDDACASMARELGLRAYCGHPLVSQDRVIGTLAFGSYRRDSFARDEVDLMRTVAEHVAVALRRVEQDRALRESEFRFRTLANAMPQMAWIADHEGWIHWYNQRWYDYTGTTPEQMAGWGWQKVHDPAELPGVLSRWNQSLATGEPFDMTFPIRGGDGSFRPFLTRVMPLRDRSGRVVQWFGTNTDISEQLRTEAALREKEATLRSFYDSAPFMLGILEFVGDTLVHLSGNRAVEEFLQKPIMEILGRSTEQMGAPDALQKLWVEKCRESLAMGGPVKFDYARSRDGATLWLCGTVSPIGPSPRGNPMLSFVSEDITVRKKAEEDLGRANEELRAAGEALRVRNEELWTLSDQLAAANEQLEQRVLERTAKLRALAAELTQSEESERRRIAKILHDDLQQLLVAARMHLGTFRMERDSDSGRDSLRHAEDMITQSIAVARDLSHDLSLVVLQEQGLGSALQWLGGWMRQHHGLHVALEADPDFKCEDENLGIALFQGARELLLNASKHAGVREARLSLALAGSGEIELTVSDRGRGFDPVKVRPGDGSGFGVFSIRERFLALGGRVDIESAPGRGCLFRVVAPLHLTPPGEPEAADGASKAGQAPEAPVKPPHEEGVIHLLLADDHKMMRDGLAALLRKQPGIEITGLASDGEEAVDLVRERQPDIVIMDVNMRRMDGIEATRHIAASWPHVAVIGLTMHVDRTLHEAMLKSGAVKCLVKSGPSEELINAIRAAAAQQAARG